MNPEEREKKRRWMVEYNRRREASAAKAAQPDLDALNAIYGTRFRYGQQVTVTGRRYTIIGAKWGAWLRVKNKDGKKFVCRPYDAYPVINLSGTVTFDGWMARLLETSPTRRVALWRGTIRRRPSCTRCKIRGMERWLCYETLHI